MFVTRYASHTTIPDVRQQPVISVKSSSVPPADSVQFQGHLARTL
jgi:hypothetical protein